MFRFSVVKPMRYIPTRIFSINITYRSSIPRIQVSEECKQLPNGIVLEVLNPEIHDLEKIRQLLTMAYVVNREPIIHTLRELAYPGRKTRDVLPIMEQNFKNLFTDEFLVKKMQGNLGFVAIDKLASGRYISSAFVERHSETTYGKNEMRLLRDPFWRCGLQLMGDLHEKARPFLSQYNPSNVAFMSHAATWPGYGNLGLMSTVMTRFLSRLASHGYHLVYGLLSNKTTAEGVEEHFGYFPVAEIHYANYEIDGEKVFSHLTETCLSAKVMAKLF